jgi:hypothetical protein
MLPNIAATIVPMNSTMSITAPSTAARTIQMIFLPDPRPAGAEREP